MSIRIAESYVRCDTLNCGEEVQIAEGEAIEAPDGWFAYKPMSGPGSGKHFCGTCVAAFNAIAQVSSGPYRLVTRDVAAQEGTHEAPA